MIRPLTQKKFYLGFVYKQIAYLVASHLDEQTCPCKCLEVHWVQRNPNQCKPWKFSLWLLFNKPLALSQQTVTQNPRPHFKLTILRSMPEKETDKLASKTYSFTSTENFSILTIYVQTVKRWEKHLIIGLWLI